MKQTLQNIIESDDMQYSLAFLIISFVLFLILAGYLYQLTKKESPKPIQSNNDHEVIFVTGPNGAGKTLLINHLLGQSKLLVTEALSNGCFRVLTPSHTNVDNSSIDLYIDLTPTSKVNLGVLSNCVFSPKKELRNVNGSIRRVIIELRQSDFDALQWVSMQSHHIDKVYFAHSSRTHEIVNQTDILYSVYNMASSQLSPIETLIIKHKI